MDFATAAIVVAWLAIALLALGFAGLLHQVNQLRRATTPRAASGDSSLIGLLLPTSGELAALRPAGGGVVAFVSPACDSCARVLDALAHLMAPAATVVVSAGNCEPAAGGRCLENRRDLFDRFGIPATPYLMRVDGDGTITATLLPTDEHDLHAWLALPSIKGEASS